MKWQVGVVLAGLLVTTACGSGSQPAPAKPAAQGQPAAPAAPAAPQAAAPTAPAAASVPASPPPAVRMPIVFSTTSAQNSPFQLAKDQGIFRANGLEVEMSHAPGNAGPAALISGQVPVMATGCVEMVQAYAGGAADVVVFVQPTNRLQYMIVGGPNVPTPADLRGKQLAVSRIGASSHLATKFILTHLGMDPERDASYIQVGNTPERVVALLQGNIDATILSSDEGTLIGNQPGMRILVDMTKEAVPYCASALGSTRQFLRDNPDLARRLTRSFTEALARFKLNREEGMAAVGGFLNESDPQKLDSVWSTWRALFVEKPYPDPAGVQFVIDEVGQGDERVRGLTPDQVSDPTWVRELDESGFIDRLYQSAPAR